MQEECRQDYLVRLPLPLAQLYDRAYNEGDMRSQHENVFYLCETLKIERGAYASPIVPD